MPGLNIVSTVALDTAGRDNAGGGWCAKGVGNILGGQDNRADINGMGLQNGVHFHRGDGHTWDTGLRMAENEAGEPYWDDVTDVFTGPDGRPDFTDLPDGAIIIWENTGGTNGGGAEHGHVEMAATDAEGQRLFVSDAARTNYGGTVPHAEYSVFVPSEALMNELNLPNRDAYMEASRRSVDDYVYHGVTGDGLDPQPFMEWDLPPELQEQLIDFLNQIAQGLATAFGMAAHGHVRPEQVASSAPAQDGPDADAATPAASGAQEQSSTLPVAQV